MDQEQTQNTHQPSIDDHQQQANTQNSPQQLNQENKDNLVQEENRANETQKVEIKLDSSEKEPVNQVIVSTQKINEQVKEEKNTKTEEVQKNNQKHVQQKVIDKVAKKDTPKLMKCAFITAPKTIEIRQVPIPKPASGELLVKVMAAPINPSDLELYNGRYTEQKKFPTAMGLQGSGLVVQNGGGVMGWGLVGKKVAFGVQKQGQGSYSQYAIVKTDQCLPLADETTFEQGCMSVVNPLTVYGMLDLVKQRKQKCVVMTAAASQLVRMVNRLFPSQGVEVINIVRREQQVELLKKEGAKNILNSSSENFQQQLKELAEKKGARTCYEAIGGNFTGIITRAMPKNSIITVYGGLSGQNIGDISVMDLLFGNKTINTFMLVQWLSTKSQILLLPTFYKIRKLINNTLKSNIAKKFSIENVEEAIEYYKQNMTEGKIIIEGWSEEK